MRIKHYTLAAVGTALVSLVGCAEQPTAQEQVSADYGRAMSQAECQSLARSTIGQALKDAESARFQFGTCEKRGLNSIPIMNIPKQYGYAMEVQVNAKNSYGGYTGFRSYGILMKDGKVIRRLREDDDGIWFPF